MIFLTAQEKKKSIFDGIRGEIPANVRQDIGNRIEKFIGDDVILEGLFPFRYMLKNGVLTINDLKTMTYDELMQMLQLYEIPQYEDYAIDKHRNEKTNPNSLTIK